MRWYKSSEQTAIIEVAREAWRCRYELNPNYHAPTCFSAHYYAVKKYIGGLNAS